MKNPPRFGILVFAILVLAGLAWGCGGGRQNNTDPPLEQIYPPRTLDAPGAAAVRRAAAIADTAHETARSKLLQAFSGVITEQDVVDAILATYSASGADPEPCYPPIVASGADALLPNGDISNDAARRIATDSLFVLIGLAPRVDGYCAASARTYFFGEPPDEMWAAFDAANQALDAGIAAVRSGAAVADIANAMGQVMITSGLGAYMTWSPGFGLFTYVHAGPLIASDYHYNLVPIQALALEPGAIVPDRFGVRLMDTVLLTADGVENLTAAPRTSASALLSSP